MLTTFAQWLQTMAQTATSAAGQAGGAGDRLTSVDGRVLASQHLLAVIDPAAPLPLPHTWHPIAPILTPPQLPLSPEPSCVHRCFLFIPHGAPLPCWRACCSCRAAAPSNSAYNQAPQLVYWRLNNYFNLTDAQADRLRSELGDLHQWHRDQMLPQHAALLQQVQQRLADDITADQACRVYADVRCRLTSSSRRWSPGSWCSHRS